MNLKYCLNFDYFCSIQFETILLEFFFQKRAIWWSFKTKFILIWKSNLIIFWMHFPADTLLATSVTHNFSMHTAFFRGELPITRPTRKSVENFFRNLKRSVLKRITSFPLCVEERRNQRPDCHQHQSTVAPSRSSVAADWRLSSASGTVAAAAAGAYESTAALLDPRNDSRLLRIRNPPTIRWSSLILVWTGRTTQQTWSTGCRVLRRLKRNRTND